MTNGAWQLRDFFLGGGGVGGILSLASWGQSHE